MAFANRTVDPDIKIQLFLGSKKTIEVLELQAMFLEPDPRK
jgi:hypothetical protein